MSDLGGDPAGWLDQVCPDCGAALEDGSGHQCLDGVLNNDVDGRAPICPHCGVTALAADASHVVDTRFVCENPDCDAFGEMC